MMIPNSHSLSQERPFEGFLVLPLLLFAFARQYLERFRIL